MRPESFARWSPNVKRQEARFIVRPGVDSEVEPCLRLLAAIGISDEASWRQTLTRTVHDADQRVLFVAEVQGEIAGYGRAVLIENDLDTPHAAPAGWYLLGLVVAESWRRHGIGESLRRARIAWVAQRADHLYYFTLPRNHASQALHKRLGFVKVTGSWVTPGGNGQQLYSLALRADVPTRAT